MVIAVAAFFLTVAPQSQKDDSKVATLIERLASAAIEERDRAAAQLVKQGLTVLPHLEKAVSTKDQEQALRIRAVIQELYDQEAKQILRQIRAGIRSASTLAIHAKVVGKVTQPQVKESPDSEFKVFISAPDRLLIQEVQDEGKTAELVAATKAEVTLAGTPVTHLPKDFPEQASEAIGSLGVLGTLMSVLPKPFRERPIDYRKDIVPVKVTTTKEGLREGRISYEIASTHSYFAQPIRIELWHTGSPPRPTKRVIEMEFPKTGKVVKTTETYLKWSTKGEWPE